MTNYPELGKAAKFFRVNDKGEFSQGEGIVKAIFLDPNKRVMVQIENISHNDDAPAVLNVDIYAVNAGKDEAERYKALMANVLLLQEEGNKLVKETVEAYNSKVEQAYNAVIGEPVKYGKA